MNIDFATLCLISVPGFLVGIMTGRFVASPRWQSTKRLLGIVGRLFSSIVFIAYLGVTLIILGIIFIYIINIPETAQPANFWIILFIGCWMVFNLILEILDTSKRRQAKVSIRN
jgi:hypothetical protein